jgi:hypothetical protein
VLHHEMVRPQAGPIPSIHLFVTLIARRCGRTEGKRSRGALRGKASALAHGDRLAGV